MRCLASILAAGICLCSFKSPCELANGPDDYNSRLWQMEDGLPNNTVQAIEQTRDGYLWVGTREGLARFDGVKFQSVDLLAEHAPLSISSLHQSRDGSLFIGTDSSGLFRLTNGHIERCKGPGGTLDFDVQEIHESGDGAIWITSSAEALRWADGKMERRAKLRRVQQGMCVDTNGAVWTIGGALTRLDTTAPTNYVPQSGSLGFTARCLYCDADGTFWIGEGENLVRMKNGTVTNFRKPEGPSGYVSVIFRNSAGELWVGSYFGLHRFVNEKFISQGEPDAPQYRIYAIFEDRERNLWVGSEEGLLRLTPKVFKTITKKDGLTVNTVASVCASRDGSVWISPWSFGLNHWVDGKITVLNQTNGLSYNCIMAMAEGRDGSLWAGADNGGELNRIKDGQITTFGQKQGFILSRSTATTALFEDERRVLWIGSRELLQCWDENHFSHFTTNDGLSHQKINAICGGTGSVVWIGTEGGLTRWHDGQFENLAATNARLKILILSLYEDSGGSLWIGTKGNGLLRLKGDTVQSFTSAQGLFSDAIYSILEDGHTNLWLNSSRGIFRLDKNQLEAVANGQRATITSISYGKADGILSSGQYKEVTQPSACRSADGRLWFRTTQGVAVVNPDEITLNALPPPVVIQAVIADKQRVGDSVSKLEVGGKIIVPPGRGELEVHYEALSFRSPEKNQFRYKLDGADFNWVDAGTRRVAFYNNLRPGHYRFQVMACNNDGVWSEAGAAVELTFKPHFWQTWWFISLCVLGTISLVGGMVRYVTRQRMQRKLALLERQNAVEKERARIARDMHDELGAKLTRISFQGDTARRLPSNSPETDQYIVKMSETARELILSLDQIVWAVDPENDSLENLASYVCRYASEFTADSPVQCKLKVPWELPSHHLSTDVRHNVFLAVKEALNNVLKHSGATEIVLTISTRPDEFEISIVDNGRGISAKEGHEPKKNKRNGRGLANMRERLASIHGKFELKSAPVHGTEVRLIVPLGKEAGRAPYVYPN
jgi:signal transduction histidine kinase/ligand-binding sensor domain-containing protein